MNIHNWKGMKNGRVAVTCHMPYLCKIVSSVGGHIVASSFFWKGGGSQGIMFRG